MKKENNVRSKFVKDSLLDYDKLAADLKEGTTNAVRDLLSETVRDTYNKILMEKEEDEYEEEEVEDTEGAEDEDLLNDADDITDDDNESSKETKEDELEPEDGEADTDVEVSDDGDDVEIDSEGTDEDGTEWAEFDKYKIGDDEYDFSEAEDDEIVKVYKLLKDDDQVMVTQKDDKISIKDNETGAEYLVVLDEDNPELETEDIDDMNESRIYEIALDEYDSNVGYTDSYQKQDVMSNPGMSEPGKNVNDWDAGVPKGDKKPWSGYPGKKNRADKPFNEEEIPGGMEGAGDIGAEDMEIDESIHTGTQNGPQRRTTTISQVPNTSRSKKVGRNRRTAEKGQVSGTGKAAYQGVGEEDAVKESIARKAEKIFNENQELKAALGKFRNVLKEAALTNVNLGKIIKLISENTTTQDEKMEIIKRFGKEAKTIKDSERLYESISSELSRKPKMNITEGKAYDAPKQINETTIYKSKDMLDSLELMHKLCK